MRRSLPFLLVVLVLGALGALSWLTHNPDCAAARQAESWPVIGPWAKKFRVAYQTPPALTGEEAAEPVFVFREPQGPAAPPWEGAPEYLWVLEGTQILGNPQVGAPSIRRLNAITNLARLERRGDWFRVWYHGQEGWIHLPGYREDVPPLGTAPDPVLPLPARAPEARRLERARALLGEEAYELEWAGYRVYTDSWDSNLLGLMGKVLIRLEETYRDRYGLDPLGRPAGAIVLYQRQENLEELQRLEGLANLPASGHAARGVAALAVGERPQHEVVSTLIHEVSHLMHRRALGPALPPWLDEGLSDDLANLGIRANGSLDDSRWSGLRLEGGGRVTYEGALASLRVSTRMMNRGAAPSLAELLAYDWETFVVSERSRLHYDLAAFFVRYLLEDPERGKAFRAFLAATAGGEPISPESVRQRLDRPWPTIQVQFEAWLGQQSGLARSAEPEKAPATLTLHSVSEGGG